MTTFRELAAEYCKHNPVGAAAEQKRQRFLRYLDEHADQPVTALNATHFLAVTRPLLQSGRADNARRFLRLASHIFRWGFLFAEGVPPDPTTSLQGVIRLPAATPRPAITDPDAFGALCRAVWTSRRLNSTERAALQLLTLTAVRPSELRLARWEEFDLERAVWRIPSERMKMRREHLVTLSRQAVAVLRPLAGSDFVFPSSYTDGLSALGENALNRAIARLVPRKVHVPHGFRASFSTLCSEAGEESELVELCLAHQKRNRVASIYDRSQRVEERRGLMQRWADRVEAWVSKEDWE